MRSICERLIVSGRTLEKLEDAFHHFPNLLTLEDLVARYGSDWGIADEAINASKARSQYFDQIAGGQRYA